MIEMRTRYERERGYSRLNATARVCQDVVLSKIAASSMSRNVTVKGGVLMCGLSGNSRRATRDIDLDFVCYSISDDSIRSFVRILSDVDDDVSLYTDGSIEELSQQDYRGKRVHLKVRDESASFSTKLDLGVHADLSVEQDERWFDVLQSDEGVCLLANSKEQMFSEKLKALLRHGVRSTRFRDLYDMYYIGHRGDLDRKRLIGYIEAHIIGNPDMWDDDMAGVIARAERTLSNRQFLDRMESSHRDWLGKSVEEVASWLLRFLGTLRE